ncbi:MAG: hypothetical protein PVJ83_01470 [Gammaproteobacteria bacterium]
MSAVISGDIFGRHESGQTWLASVHTRPGTTLTPVDQESAIVAQDNDRRVAFGELGPAVDAGQPSILNVSLLVDAAQAGIPARSAQCRAAAGHDPNINYTGAGRPPIS